MVRWLYSDKMWSFCCSLFKSPNKIPWYTLILIKNVSLGMCKCCSFSFSHSNWLISFFMVWNSIQKLTAQNLSLYGQSLILKHNHHQRSISPVPYTNPRGEAASKGTPLYKFLGGGISRDQAFCILHFQVYNTNKTSLTCFEYYLEKLWVSQALSLKHLISKNKKLNQTTSVCFQTPPGSNVIL